MKIVIEENNKEFSFPLFLYLMFAKTSIFWGMMDNNYVDILRIVVILLALMPCLYYKPSKIFVALLIYTALWIFCFFIYSNPYNRNYSGFFNLAIFLSECVLIEHYIRKNKFGVFAKTFIIAGFILFVLNDFVNIESIIYSTDYIKTDFYGTRIMLLGQRTHLVLFFSEWIMITYLFLCREKNNQAQVIIWLAVGISFYKLAKEWAAAGLAAISLIALFLIVKKHLQSFNRYTYLFIGISLPILIFFIKIQNLLSGFITNVLHRDLTFTGRIYVWDMYLSVIKEHIFLGYNRGGLFITALHKTLNPHNMWLNILYDTGVFGLSIIVTIMIFIARNIKQYEKSAEVQFTIVVLSVLLINAMFELIAASFFPFFMLAYYLPKIISSKNRLADGEIDIVIKKANLVR